MDEIEMPTRHDTGSRRTFLASGARIVAASGMAAFSIRSSNAQPVTGVVEHVLRATSFMASPDGRS